MSPLRRRNLPWLPLWVALVAPAFGQGLPEGQPEAAVAPAVQDEAAAPPAADREDLRRAIRQSRRASFNAHSAELALVALSAGLESGLRPAALFAMGAAGERSMMPRLESWAVEGSPVDRRAAILGIGEGGLGSVDLLGRLARSSVVEVREAAMLSLARLDTPAARAAFERLLQADAPDPDAARRAQRFAQDPQQEPDFAAGRALLDLRWEAARRHGWIDGKPWRAHLMSELLADEAFLDAVVYAAASDLRKPGSADHFLQIALGGGDPARLRPVANAIPNELERMVRAGVWYPTTQEEWAQILYEIDDRHLETLTLELLRQARLFPDLSAHASVLLVRGGNLEGLSLLELDLASPDPIKRERIAETLGGTRESRYVDLLETLRADESARVRAAAGIAQMRLGHALSADAVRDALAGPANEERRALVSCLARLAYLPEMAGLLFEYLDGFLPEERLEVAIELARAGDSRELPTLQAALGEAVLRSPLGEQYVRALVRVGANAEVASLLTFFPLEDSRAVNVQIALAMCVRRDPAVLPLLRAALWRGPFDRSVLAGGLIVHAAGIDSLRVELDRPPKGALPADVRRVGYALGEWGGTPEVERLGRRRTAADPALQGALLGALGARTH